MRSYTKLKINSCKLQEDAHQEEIDSNVSSSRMSDDGAWRKILHDQ